MGLIVGIAIASAFILGALAMMAHGFLLAVQEWATVIYPSPTR